MTGKIDASRKPQRDGYTVRTFKEGDEQGLSALFTSAAFENPVAEWVWRHRSSPYFDPSLVVAAEKDGEIVGGTHAQKRVLKLEESLTVEASVGSGLMVKDEHRQQGIATNMMRLLRANLKKRDVILHYSVPESWAFQYVYSKRAALMVGEKMHQNAVYSKRFIKNSAARKVASINTLLDNNPSLRNRLAGLDIIIKFVITGYPPSTFILVVDDGRLAMKETETGETDITVTSKDLTSSISALMRMLLFGRIRTKGLLANSLKLLKCLRILRKIVNSKADDSD